MLGSMPMNGFVPVKDGDKARAFYEGVLGLELISDNEWVATYRVGANKIMLQKGAGADFKPDRRTIVGWEVTGIRDVVDELTKRGVVFEHFEWMEQDDHGIWNSPDGKVAWFKDPDGNTLSVSEH